MAKGSYSSYLSTIVRKKNFRPNTKKVGLIRHCEVCLKQNLWVVFLFLCKCLDAVMMHESAPRSPFLCSTS